jgi:hypothetical protein
MEVLELLKRALKACANAIKYGATIQETTRRELTSDLQQICSRCEDAYGAVLKRLKPIKDAFGNPGELAKELREFAADTETRNSFKPEHLCGEIDHLIVRLQSNLDPLKYSVDYSRIQEIQRNLQTVGDYDSAINRSYDEFARQLDSLATQLSATAEPEERHRYVQHVISDFESELRSAIDDVRNTKKAILQGT